MTAPCPGNEGGLGRAMRYQHEEGDSRSDAEQDDGTQHMDEFQQQIFQGRPALAQAVYPETILASSPDQEHDNPTRSSRRACPLLVLASRGMSDGNGGAKLSIRVRQSERMKESVGR